MLLERAYDIANLHGKFRLLGLNPLSSLSYRIIRAPGAAGDDSLRPNAPLARFNPRWLSSANDTRKYGIFLFFVHVVENHPNVCEIVEYSHEKTFQLKERGIIPNQAKFLVVKVDIGQNYKLHTKIGFPDDPRGAGA